MRISENKILRINVCTLSGNLLLSVADNFSFPKQFDSKRDLLIIKGKNLPVFPRGAKVNIIINTKAGDRISYNSDIDVSTEWQLNLSFMEKEGKALEERRRYFKIACDAPCKVSMLNRNDDLEEFDPTIPAQIDNINLGGVFLRILGQALELKVEDVVTLIFPNIMGSRLEMMVKILRVQLNPNGEIQGYGGCFLMLTTSDEQVLAKYINHLQIEKRKSEMD